MARRVLTLVLRFNTELFNEVIQSKSSPNPSNSRDVFNVAVGAAMDTPVALGEDACIHQILIRKQRSVFDLCSIYGGSGGHPGCLGRIASCGVNWPAR